jgi:hypothetical protein
MKTYHKKNPSCAENMTFEECELSILRQAVDENETLVGAKIANSEDVKKIIKILESFLIRKKRICYGGTAINNILPSFAQFYNRDIEIPDYDFFSDHALEDAKELADIYYDAGYTEVEAKSGMHHGTFKVFVNFIPVADITYLEEQIYKSIQKEAISRAGIKYAPPNFLRMSMFLELSRPLGDVSRWEKVLKRLTLLNKYYPLKTNSCATVDFQRDMEKDSNRSEKLYLTVRDTLIDQGVVFFGGYATSLYGRYMPAKRSRDVKKIPDFDVLSEDIDTCALIVLESLKEAGFDKCKEIRHEAIGELIPERIEILVEKETVAFIYKPIACHNYNTITISDKQINVATIDTMLSFYLAFIYADLPYFNKDRILCMAEYLFDVEQQNRLEQKGLLKRFAISCYGKQARLEDIRAEKTKKYKELAEKRGTRDYEMWFLKYIPENNRSKPAKKLIEPKNSITEKEKPKPKKAKNTTVKKSKQVRFMELFK